MTDRLKTRIRAPNEDDWAFVRDSWKKSYRESQRHIPSSLYWRAQSSEVDGYIGKAEFRVACDPDDADFIWGWACLEGETVHYVFVRNSSRGQGIASMLTSGIAHPIQCSHWSEAAEKIAAKHPGALTYAPSRRKR